MKNSVYKNWYSSEKLDINLRKEYKYVRYNIWGQHTNASFNISWCLFDQSKDVILRI